MRGVLAALFVLFVTILIMFVAIPSVEGVGETVKTYGSIDQEMDGTGMINDIYKAVFQWVPLLMVGGFLVYGIAWYLHQERFTGRY